MVVVNRYLAHDTRKGYRHLAARIHVAKEYVRDGIACFGTAHPRLENRRHIVDDPADGWWSSIYYHDDGWFTCTSYFLYQIHLPAREVQGASRCCLAHHLFSFAN